MKIDMLLISYAHLACERGGECTNMDGEAAVLRFFILVVDYEVAVT